MTLEELYACIGGNYEEALARLRSERLIGKFVVKFLDDSTCKDLFDAWERGDEQAAFEAAHSAKGVCMNLAFDKLATLASEITEALRPGNDDLRAEVDVDALVKKLAAAYETAIQQISAYVASAS